MDHENLTFFEAASLLVSKKPGKFALRPNLSGISEENSTEPAIWITYEHGPYVGAQTMPLGPLVSTISVGKRLLEGKPYFLKRTLKELRDWRGRVTGTTYAVELFFPSSEDMLDRKWDVLPF
jgi:hypothetical protein